MASLQTNLPSSVHTVLRTASKLQPFSFNRAAALPPPPAGRSFEARHYERKQQQMQASREGATAAAARAMDREAAALCALCAAPREEDAARAADGGRRGAARRREDEPAAGDMGGLWAASCPSCQWQILAHAARRDAEWWRLLPPLLPPREPSETATLGPGSSVEQRREWAREMVAGHLLDEEGEEECGD